LFELLVRLLVGQVLLHHRVLLLHARTKVKAAAAVPVIETKT
jgi:hypothetical protein